MICLIQRAAHGSVRVNQQVIGEIQHGMVVLTGFQPHDDENTLDKMAHKLLHYRLFADADDKMNLNVMETNGGVLLVPQFTLAADTKKGLRPSFSSSASPSIAEPLFRRFVEIVQQQHPKVACGQFGADMQVALTNDGPVTFWLEN